jgi:hypothetical protein
MKILIVIGVLYVLALRCVLALVGAGRNAEERSREREFSSILAENIEKHAPEPTLGSPSDAPSGGGEQPSTRSLHQRALGSRAVTAAAPDPLEVR